MKTVTILIIDDDEDDRFMLQQAFETLSKNVRLELKSSSKDAIEYLQTLPEENTPCLIVLDYNMPIFNGKEILILLSTFKNLVNVPKVVLSTSNAPNLVQDCLNNGAAAFMVKPSVFDDLLVVAKDLLAFCSINSIRTD